MAGLFTDVESKLAGAAAAHEERVRSSQQSEAAGEAAPLAASGGADASSSSGDAAGGDAAASKQALVEKMAAKMGGTKDFLESHLMRASVLAPVGADDPASPPTAAAPAAGAIGSSKPAAGDGRAAANGAANAAAASGEEEEEEMHHAAGMGATAVSVVVRGNKVIVANTGGWSRGGEQVRGVGGRCGGARSRRGEVGCAAYRAPGIVVAVAMHAHLSCCLLQLACSCIGPMFGCPKLLSLLKTVVPCIPSAVLQATRAACCPSGARRGR